MLTSAVASSSTANWNDEEEVELLLLIDLERNERIEYGASNEHLTVYHGIDKVDHVNQRHGVVNDRHLSGTGSTQTGTGKVIIHQGKKEKKK
jgi:hypothetical protein